MELSSLAPDYSSKPERLRRNKGYFFGYGIMGAATIVGCCYASFFIDDWLYSLVPPTSPDYRPFLIAGGIIFLASTFFSLLPRWRWIDVIPAFLLSDAYALYVISTYSGFTGYDLFHSFNLDYLLIVAFVTSISWLTGAAAAIPLRHGIQRRRSNLLSSQLAKASLPRYISFP
jgi:hypothetical protein